MTRIESFFAGRTPPTLYETYLVPGLFRAWAEDAATFATPGDNCLDLACGTGIISRALADRHGKDLSITAVDVTPPMIDEARKHTPGWIDFQIASADDLPFDDETFDIVFCQQGVQFFPEKEASFREVFRVLKPGGRFIASVWRPVEEAAPIFHALQNAIAQYLSEDLIPLGPFSFGGQERLRTLAQQAGFTVDRLDVQDKQCNLPPIEDLVLFESVFLGKPGPDGSLQPMLPSADPASDEIVGRIIDHMTAELVDFIDENGNVSSPIGAYILIASK